MLSLNIFKIIGDFFTNVLFLPFKWLRLTVANSDYGWWTSNAINWFFLLVLIVVLSYWVGQILKFKREGTEDIA